MSTASGTKIFGVRIGVDPKIIVVALVAVSVFLFWYNSGDQESGSGTQTAATVRPQAAAPASTAPERRPVPMRRTAAEGQGRDILRMRTVDATHGDVDPTLRLGLLARLEGLKPPGSTRNLFELGAASTAAAAQPIKAPTIMPKPLPVVNAAPGVGPGPAPTMNVNLKYYGFVQPVGTDATNRGFFLDGDNVLIAAEGQMLDQRYLVVALTPNSARLEDVQMKQGQTLNVVTEAMPQ